MNPPILATRNLGLDIGGATIVADVSARGCRGRAARDHRPERRRQDLAVQPALRASTGRRRARSSSAGATSRSQPTYPPHAGGARPDVPGVERLPAADRARERAARGRVGARRHAPPVAARGERQAGARAGARGARARRARGRTRSCTAGSLAHGDKRRLEIAMLLAADKPVLMLDEPMAGLSAEHVPAARRADPRRSTSRSARRC